MISYITLTFKIDCSIVNEVDEGYIRLDPFKAQIEWFLIKTSLVVNSLLTVEAAARSKSGVGFSGDNLLVAGCTITQ